MERQLRVLRQYPEEMEWNVPLLLNNDRVARDLLTTFRVVSGIKLFSSIYGGFKSPWSSGRGSVVTDVYDLGYVPNVADFNSLGVKCWITLSRYDIKDYNDSKMWSIIKFLSNLDCGIIVSSDRLAMMIKDRYPNIEVMASVIKFTREYLPKVLSGEYLEEEELLSYITALDLYDYVVARPEFIISNYNLIPDYLRSRVEVMVNQYCTANCPSAVYHYDLIEKFEDTGIWEGFECASRKSYLDCVNNVVMDYDFICKLSEVGYRNFKLQGRGLSPRCAIDQVGKYICEPTGLIHILGEQIIQNIEKEKSQGIINRF